jgi:hypothetical protein
MNPNPPNSEFQQGLNPEQKKHFDLLQQTLAETDQRSRRYEEAWSGLFDQNKTLREENHRLQHDYESLRIQKGGFGFKMLLVSGMGGFLTALVLCFVYLKLKPKDAHTVALADFRRTHLFEYELALSKKQFDEVKTSLDNELSRPENKAIRTNLEILRDMVEAAERGCQNGH